MLRIAKYILAVVLLIMAVGFLIALFGEAVQDIVSWF